MQSFNSRRFLVAVCGLIFALAVHCLNGSLNDPPGVLHTTADDASYTAPAWNFLENGTWKDNTTGASAYVQRPPAMGIFHLAGYLLADKNAPLVVLCFAFLLHALALFGLAGIFRRFVADRTALILTALYALLPCFWGFLSYSITEAVSASLVILTLAAAFSERRYSAATTLLLITACWFLRPVLLLLFPVVIVELMRKRQEVFKRNHALNVAALVLCVCAVFLWEYRKAGYLGRWFDLHPIYHESNQSMFRPVHRELSDLFRVWETRPEDFHELTGYCWNTEISANDAVVAHYYEEHAVPLGKMEFGTLMEAYSKTERQVAARFGNATMSESPAEKKLSATIREAAKRARKSDRWAYAFGTPLRSAREMLSKSQLNLELFQVHWRGHPLTEALRYLCAGTIVFSLVTSLLAFFTGKRELMLLSAGILLYLFYLFFIQRMCEDRYLLPAMPVMLICSFSSLAALFGRKKSLN